MRLLQIRGLSTLLYIYVAEVISYVTLCWLRDCTGCRPTAARLSSGSLADFLTRKDLADFLLEALLDFLAVRFAYAVYNILSYLNIKTCHIKGLLVHVVEVISYVPLCWLLG